MELLAVVLIIAAVVFVAKLPLYPDSKNDPAGYSAACWNLEEDYYKKFGYYPFRGDYNCTDLDYYKALSDAVDNKWELQTVLKRDSWSSGSVHIAAELGMKPEDD